MGLQKADKIKASADFLSQLKALHVYVGKILTDNMTAESIGANRENELHIHYESKSLLVKTGNEYEHIDNLKKIITKGIKSENLNLEMDSNNIEHSDGFTKVSFSEKKKLINRIMDKF